MGLTVSSHSRGGVGEEFDVGLESFLRTKENAVEEFGGLFESLEPPVNVPKADEQPQGQYASLFPSKSERGGELELEEMDWKERRGRRLELTNLLWTPLRLRSP